MGTLWTTGHPHKERKNSSCGLTPCWALGGELPPSSMVSALRQPHFTGETEALVTEPAQDETQTWCLGHPVRSSQATETDL